MRQNQGQSPDMPRFPSQIATNSRKQTPVESEPEEVIEDPLIAQRKLLMDDIEKL